MKRILILCYLISLAVLISCKNEKWSFPDYYYSTVYFPYQYPFRTLVLGDYETADNSGDNNLQFVISAHIGGMYNNDNDRTVDFEIVPNLAERVVTSTKDTLKLLPSGYYTLNPTSQFVIPKGKFFGGFTVQLKDDFLNDTMAYRNYYILPVKITSSSLDTILSGKPASSGTPDPRIAALWTIAPKDFTLFGIKFINPYHGHYLHRGRSIAKDGTGNPIDTVTYHKQYVEQDEIWHLTTNGRNSVMVTGVVKDVPSPGSFIMDLTFDANGNCVITKNKNSAFDLTGTGKFVKNGDSWGNKPRNSIILAYQIATGARTLFVNDTLVVRDRAVGFESFVPLVY